MEGPRNYGNFHLKTVPTFAINNIDGSGGNEELSKLRIFFF